MLLNLTPEKMKFVCALYLCNLYDFKLATIRAVAIVTPEMMTKKLPISSCYVYPVT